MPKLSWPSVQVANVARPPHGALDQDADAVGDRDHGGDARVLDASDVVEPDRAAAVGGDAQRRRTSPAAGAQAAGRSHSSVSVKLGRAHAAAVCSAERRRPAPPDWPAARRCRTGAPSRPRRGTSCVLGAHDGRRVVARRELEAGRLIHRALDEDAHPVGHLEHAPTHPNSQSPSATAVSPTNTLFGAQFVVERRCSCATAPGSCTWPRPADAAPAAGR